MLSNMGKTPLVGPVQTLMIGFDGPAVPRELRQHIRDLRDNTSSVRLIDVLELHRDPSGVIERREPDGLGAESEPPGHVLHALLDRARSRSILATPTLANANPDGRGFLFAGDVLPDPRDTLPNGSSAVLLALEHRWALPLRDAVLATSGSPLADAWLGRDALREVGLIASDATTRSG